MIQTREQLLYQLKELEELVPSSRLKDIMQSENKATMDELIEWIQVFEKFCEDLNAEHHRQNELASKTFVELYKYVEYLNEEL